MAMYRAIALLIAIFFTTVGLKAQTVDLACSGQVTQEYLLIGKPKQRDPLVYQKNVNYHFFDGKFIKSVLLIITSY